jgi:hypothetical protein
LFGVRPRRQLFCPSSAQWRRVQLRGGDTLNRIAMTEGVLSAALVFHGIDTG